MYFFSSPKQMKFFKKKVTIDVRTWGYPGHLDASQESALQDFKRQCGATFDASDDDYKCCQFLRARKFDVGKAVTMFRDMKSWRHSYGADYVLQEALPHGDLIRKHIPKSHHKYDKTGRPIFIELVGYQDLKLLVEGHNIPLDEVVRFQVQMLEHQRALMQTASAHYGTKVGNVISILDLQGASMKRNMNKVSREFAKQIAHIGQQYYPESLGKMFIINAPSSFGTAWRFIKPFLDPRTVNKIEVLKGDPRARLLEFIDADQLPHFLGGTCNCPGGCVQVDQAAVQAAQSSGPDDEDVEGELGALTAGGGDDGPPPPSDEYVEEISEYGSPAQR